MLDSKVRVCVVIFEAHSESIKAREITNKVDQKVNRTFEKQLRDQSWTPSQGNNWASKIVKRYG